jgi:exportin-7
MGGYPQANAPFVLQPVDQQQRLSQCFDKLMADVSRNLEPKNRDRFTQNLTAFRHDFRLK